ncbi:MAG: DUF2330 domain-containing protein [Myxococcota bacterium]|nr:DUF2330 domain-containing protein [Myxococcota bacterium]
MKRSALFLFALLTSICGLVTIPGAAQACGGFFCSAVQLQPVEQNAERILFEINPDNTVTAIVEISYVGDPADFSWVVPVGVSGSDELTLDVEVPSDVIGLLDDATAPSIIPPQTKCSELPAPRAPFAFNDSAMMGAESDGMVDVEELPVVGPYAPQLVSSDDPEALVDWLNENDFLITAEMEPFVADYVSQGKKFLAMKLTPGSEVADVAPISITYPGDTPSIPIVLTSVAAEPEMGVMALIAADSRYEASNFVNLEVATDDVSMNPRTGMNNYYPLISWKADQAGGSAAFTEFVDGSDFAATRAINQWSGAIDFNTGEPLYEDSLAWIEEFRGRHTTLSRLYTRLSGWEMVIDPSFSPSDQGSVSGVHDLSDRPAVEVCGPAAVEDAPCGDMYCGDGALCATTDTGVDGCLCPEGTVARLIQEPNAVSNFLQTTVTCQLESHDMMASLADLDLPFGAGDPCAEATCGENGSCVALNGFATCDCDEGFAAIPGDASPICVEARQAFSPDALVWTPSCAGCSSADDEGAGGMSVLLLVGLALLGQRRRSRA